jgi:hypothetical protein
MGSAIQGGDDVIQMPRYYRPWAEGLPELRTKLRVVGQMTELSKRDKEVAVAGMHELGVAADQRVVLPMMGKGKPLVAVIDPATSTIRALIRVD